MEGMPRYFANEGESRPSKIVDNRSCEMCKQGDESVLHVLWECGIAQDVWAGSKLCMQKCTTFRTDFLKLVEDLMERLQVEDLEYFFVQCWVLWNQRNSVVHRECILGRLHLEPRGFKWTPSIEPQKIFFLL